jgi:hypothetical protein
MSNNRRKKSVEVEANMVLAIIYNEKAIAE